MKLDGRKRAVVPVVLAPRTRTTNAQVRSVISAFDAAGATFHSGRHTMLVYVIDHCERNKIPYTLKAQPGEGYFIQRTDAK